MPSESQPNDEQGQRTSKVTRELRSVVGRGVRATIGTLPLYERRLAVSRWRQTRRLTAIEEHHFQTWQRRLDALPEAKVATIIPTFRRPDLLELAVSSALGQTMQDHCVIVVDDGAGIEASLPDDPRLTVIELDENIGTAGVVRNVGIRLTRSEYIAFLDDDNTWLPHHLETSMRGHDEGAELTFTKLRRVGETGEEVDVIGEEFDRHTMKETSQVDTNVIVVQRRDDVSFSRVPRRRGDFPLEDWELVWRLSRHLRVQHIPEITVTYVQHSGSDYSAWGDPENVPAPRF